MKAQTIEINCLTTLAVTEVGGRLVRFAVLSTLYQIGIVSVN